MTSTAGAGRSESPTARRERRLSQRRDRVFEAAVSLFVERGYEGTTIDEIAERADVARSSVFNYFDRKSSFLDEWAARRRTAAFRQAEGADTPLEERVGALMSTLASISSGSRAETVAMFVPAVRELWLLDDPPLARELTALVTEHGSGARAPRADPGLIGLTLATGYFAVLTAWCKGDEAPFDLAERLSDLVQLIMSPETARR